MALRPLFLSLDSGTPRNADEVDLRDPVLLIADIIPHVIGILREHAGAHNLVRPARVISKVQMSPFSFVIPELLQQRSAPVLSGPAFSFIQFSPSGAAGIGGAIVIYSRMPSPRRLPQFINNLLAQKTEFDYNA